MPGIVFFGTEHHDEVVDFYRERVGATVWLEQTDCTILDYEGFKFGFCRRDEAETCGILTIYFDDRAGVDAAHDRLGDVAREDPHEVAAYDIYRFFAEDPEGRTVEFQTFLHPV